MMERILILLLFILAAYNSHRIDILQKDIIHLYGLSSSTSESISKIVGVLTK